MVQITANVPEDFLNTRDTEAFAKQLQLAASSYWYAHGDISMGKTAQFAGLTRPGKFYMWSLSSDTVSMP